MWERKCEEWISLLQYFNTGLKWINLNESEAIAFAILFLKKVGLLLKQVSP